MAYGGLYLASKTFGTVAQTNTTAPSFGGITSLTAGTDGGMTANWSPVTVNGAATPVRFIVYAAAGSGLSYATVAVAANIVGEARSTWTKLTFYQLGDQATYIVNGQPYTAVVRAFSATNVLDTNTATATATAVASANLPTVLQATATQTAATQVLLASAATSLTSSASSIASSAGSLTSSAASVASSASSLSSSAGSIAGSAGSLASSASSLGSSAGSIAGSAGSLASSASSLGSSASSIASSASSLSTSLAGYVTQLGLLSGAVASGSGAGGLMMTIEVNEILMTVEC